MNPIHAHIFIADPETPTDPGGHRYGRCCPLPENNQCHKPPDRPPDDWTSRALGERADE